MTQQLLPESQEKTQLHVEGSETRPDSALPFQDGLHPVAQLQRTLGNRHVATLIQAKHLTPAGKIIGVQRKLTVGAADDQYEQEADRVAHQVMNMPDTLVTASAERAPSSAGAQKQMLQSRPLAASITPVMQRQRGKENEEDRDREEEEQIQAKSAGSMSGNFDAGDDVETQLSLSKGRGSPLPDPVRSYMEPRFGIDFSHVHVHTGSDALQMNQAVGAQAFTHGSDIYFGEGRSPSNLELTAHELTHVMQQTGGAPLQTKKREEEVASPSPDSSIQRICAACAVDNGENNKPNLIETMAKTDAPSEQEKVQLNFPSTSIQRQDTPPDHLSSLNEMLDRLNVPEQEVLSLLRLLTSAEKSTVTTDPSYKSRMASAFNTGEMVQAVVILALSLDKQLEWIEAATSTSRIDYSEIRALITSASQAVRDTLKTTRWRDFFVGVCDNSTIITAVTDLHFDLQTQLEWIEEEASPSNLDYAQIRSLITAAQQANRDLLKTNRWRDFFVGVCTNTTIITAVTDLNFNLQTQLEWIEEGASPSNLDYSDIRPLITAAQQPDRDGLKTNRWRDFFVGVCTNTTIITAVTDLNFNLQTQLEWIEEEASPSNLNYSDIRPLITAAQQPDRDGLKTNRWRDFFVGVCDNSTIITAVTDLHFDLLTQLTWIEEEASPSNLDYSQIQPLITAAQQADRDGLKTDKWRGFFVGVCTNATITNALGDLNFDLLTTIQWLLEEASVSNVDFTWLCNRFKTVNVFPPGEETIACAIMERDIRDGIFNSSPEHTPAGWVTRAHNQLLVANEMGGMVGDTAKWRPSNPSSGTTFQVWASAAAQGPAPSLSAITVINCWEMVMLAAFRSGVLTWARIHTLYTSGAPDWFDFLVNELSFNKRIPYDPSRPSVRPVAGDIVFFDGASHIALAAGSLDGLGRTQIYSFWPPPNTLFTAGGTIDQVKITTIEELNDYWVGRGKPAFKIEFATPNW